VRSYGPEVCTAVSDADPSLRISNREKAAACRRAWRTEREIPCKTSRRGWQRREVASLVYTKEKLRRGLTSRAHPLRSQVSRWGDLALCLRAARCAAAHIQCKASRLPLACTGAEQHPPGQAARFNLQWDAYASAREDAPLHARTDGVNADGPQRLQQTCNRATCDGDDHG
jgi:hypothetical protein